MKLFKTSDMQIVTEIQLAFGFKPPSDIITDRVKTFCTKYESCDNQLAYISFLNCLYRVGFLCQLLLDINWFILEYIINCIGKRLQILIFLGKLFASIFLLLFIVLWYYFFCTVLVNKDAYIMTETCQ